MGVTTYQVIQVHKNQVSDLEALIKEKGLSREDLTLILRSTWLRDVKCIDDRVCLRFPYERRAHLEDGKRYFDGLRKNSARLSGIEFEVI